MDYKGGGHVNIDPLSPEEKQRQTAMEIARNKVLMAYGQNVKAQVAAAQPATATQAMKMAESPVVKPTTSTSAPNTSYKATPVQANQGEEWKQYHSAWQNYYQKYYSEYYAKAAKQYVINEQEKINAGLEDATKKQEELNQKVRQLSQELETKEIENSQLQATVTSREQAAPIEKSLKESIQAKANKKFSKRKQTRKWAPVMAGVLMVLLVLFLQYNRMIFAPIMAYVSPGNSSDTGITAIDPNVVGEVGPDPKLIVPKLNINVPVHFGISNDEATVNNAMNNGVAQFVIPGANAMPGERGTIVITGHSAGDIYSNNQYKFIFSGLERLVENDLLYINYKSVRYTYKVYRMTTVEPTDVNSLLQEDATKNTLVLVTCTPLGTSRYRLLVFAEQIDPAPEGSSTEPTVDDGTGEGTDDPGVENPSEVVEMPSNEPGFFDGIWRWLTGQ